MLALQQSKAVNKFNVSMVLVHLASLLVFLQTFVFLIDNLAEPLLKPDKHPLSVQSKANQTIVEKSSCNLLFNLGCRVIQRTSEDYKVEALQLQVPQAKL